MRQLYLYTILLIFTTQIKAQDYNHSVKLSVGTYFGIGYKKLITQKAGFEGMFHFNGNGAMLTGLRIHHQPAFPNTSSQWFFGYGYGAHLAYRTEIKSNNFFRPFAPPTVYTGNYISPGIDGYITLEYRFLKYPFYIAGNYLPNFEFFGPGVFRLNLSNISFSLAYTF